ncbi:mannose-6-phosphate isomerase, class I [Fonticula alba]|uniref:mannose-6-phosphate isomerase n=1 Tax=Fonticula alba TaxID=691883 RepID=A0A058ZBB9_FONAL|nr:mannose-6-phosphate isomerase, class I, variant [Fonticula alba]XP_009493272.1 mannose-6-phosphate isomerase, class I [Fonticula alba]KCV71693.1 mannose-6-phosphate isomerase, class I [Fonticula alba]KCV71694.1 mannose-6-phosphate isomerase, class I, variant [Fonticula alba]|eukprot:XP_009493271.1 mannose-6-phosphate isomerase, class I, variant [Fonticula alba]
MTSAERIRPRPAEPDADLSAAHPLKVARSGGTPTTGAGCAAVFPLRGAIQHYEWGTTGSESLLYKFARDAHQYAPTDDHSRTPFAELWLGTHPSGPASVLTSPEAAADDPRPASSLGDARAVTLGAFIGAQPGVLGVGAAAPTPGAELPFLLKVLSVRTALSIQVHPDRTAARLLHREFPAVYRDDNHKPEMAIALGPEPFRAMVGIRPLSEIFELALATPELTTILDLEHAGGSAVLDRPTSILPPRQDDAFEAGVSPLKHVAALLAEASSVGGAAPGDMALRTAAFRVFDCLMRAPEGVVAVQAATLLARLQADSSISADRMDPSLPVLARANNLALRLSQQYPGDRGIFCAYLLNEVFLQPGEAIFLEAGLPHAYVSGDCIECMSASDNVVRAGLTPKFRDVGTLLSILDSTPAPGSRFMVQPIPQPSDTGRPGLETLRYPSPAPEFEVDRLCMTTGSCDAAPVDVPSILLCAAGRGRVAGLECAPGSAFFVPAGAGVSLVGAGEESLILYRARSNPAADKQ